MNNFSVASSNGLVVQLVRTRACHARGQGFKSLPDRQEVVGRIRLEAYRSGANSLITSTIYVGLAKTVEGSVYLPPDSNNMGLYINGRWRPLQGRG